MILLAMICAADDSLTYDGESVLLWAMLPTIILGSHKAQNIAEWERGCVMLSLSREATLKIYRLGRSHFDRECLHCLLPDTALRDVVRHLVLLAIV